MAPKESQFIMRDEDGYVLISLAARDRIQAKKIEVGSSSSVAVVADASKERRELIIRNNSDVDIYIGHDDVSASDGFTLEPGDILRIRLTKGVLMEARAASGSNKDLRVLELN
ncbi:MAG: hypothetical protein KatS3mg015_0972 [Fimbriimonadales bacterium]|nr:MAG: hypothetical protein KatS3mg015_0972 [Fimbriimonadales bacterium]